MKKFLVAVFFVGFCHAAFAQDSIITSEQPLTCPNGQTAGLTCALVGKFATWFAKQPSPVKINMSAVLCSDSSQSADRNDSLVVATQDPAAAVQVSYAPFEWGDLHGKSGIFFSETHHPDASVVANWLKYHVRIVPEVHGYNMVLDVSNCRGLAYMGDDSGGYVGYECMLNSVFAFECK